MTGVSLEGETAYTLRARGQLITILDFPVLCYSQRCSYVQLSVLCCVCLFVFVLCIVYVCLSSYCVLCMFVCLFSYCVLCMCVCLRIVYVCLSSYCVLCIRVITKLPNSEQSYKGKVKTHKYINRQNQSTTGKL
jgi:hypothetical protein